MFWVFKLGRNEPGALMKQRDGSSDLGSALSETTPFVTLFRPQTFRQPTAWTWPCAESSVVGRWVLFGGGVRDRMGGMEYGRSSGRLGRQSR